MEFLANYGLFLLQTITLVIAILIVTLGITVIMSRGKGKEKGQLRIKALNQHYQDLKHALQHKILDKKALKHSLKQDKKQSSETFQPRVFVIHFKGDIKASNIPAFREEVTAILTVAKQDDEVVVILNSPGGLVNAYGLAASQLKRIRQRNIPLTVCIDQVAASGGYLMACVANKILAAPFAIIGSIGVVAQVPNFNRLLKKNDIDFELLTAGEYKRTLTLFGENTDKARKKFQEDIEIIHQHFKEFVTENRPSLDIDKVATGETWLGQEAKQLNLTDQVMTSDDYLLEASENKNILEISYKIKQSPMQKLLHNTEASLQRLLATLKGY